MKKTSTRLADGRELIYYDLADDTVRDAVDRRPLDATVTTSEIRHDVLLGDSVAVASHRQGRTYHPPADECPLCPSEGDRLSEIPDSSYDVVVFENRFPSLAGDSGRCEVVCFTSDHDASFASLSERQARLVLDAWTDRTSELSHLPSVDQVFCFENRGAEIGVTLQHPHGQIYAYPFTTPRTALMLRQVAAHKEATGGENLFDAVVERGACGRAGRPGGRALGGLRAVRGALAVRSPPVSQAQGAGPAGTRRGGARGVPPRVPGTAQALRPDLRENEPPTPYIAAWHQAPFGALEDFEGVTRDDFALHLELFTIRRTSGKLKFLAGSESGMNVFINDVPPERAAERLREVASS